MALDIDRIRAAFPSLGVCDADLPRIYFDNPAGTQVPQRVIDRVSDCLLRSNANLGGHFSSSRMADAVVAEAHQAMRDLLNARSEAEIVFGQNMTSLVMHVSRSIGRMLKPGDEIVLTRMDHEGNISPWLLLAEDLGLTVRWWEFDAERFEFDPASLDSLLNERTRLVAVNHASNALGTINDVAAVAARAHQFGALVFVDAVQSTPHIAIDVQALDCDFLVCSAYKFFGPHQGILWGRQELMERLSPYKVRTASNAMPHRFETGTLSHEGMAGTLGAVEHFAWIGRTMAEQPGVENSGVTARRREIVAAFEMLSQYETSLTRALLAGLASFPGVRVLGVTDPSRMHWRVPTVSFLAATRDPEAIARHLAEHNVFVWNGNNYALEVFRQLGLPESGGLRVGFAHYNTHAEVNRLLELLREFL